MPGMSVTFNRAIFTHHASRLVLESSATVKLTNSNPKGITETTVDASAFDERQIWIRSHSPLRFTLSFHFHDLNAFLPDTTHAFQQDSVASLRDASLWTQVGFSVVGIHSLDRAAVHGYPSFDVDIFLDPMPRQSTPSSCKKWRSHCPRSANDLHCPEGVSSARLDYVSLNLNFSRSGIDIDYSGGSRSTTGLNDAMMAVTDSALRTLLSRRTPRLAKGVKKGDRRASGSLQTTFPSVFSTSYVEGVLSRASLVPSISKALGAFCARTAPHQSAGFQSIFEAKTTANGPTTPTANISHASINNGTGTQLWMALLSKISAPQRDAVLSAIACAPRTSDLSELYQLSDADSVDRSLEQIQIAQQEGQCINNTISHYTNPVEYAAEEARDFDLNSLHTELQTWDLTVLSGTQPHFCNSHTFVEQAEKSILLLSSSDEWMSHRNTTPASSQSSTLSSDIFPYVEHTSSYEGGNQIGSCNMWDKLIGPCAKLTQSETRADPLHDPMLFGRLGLQQYEIYPEDLHVTVAAIENNAKGYDISGSEVDLLLPSSPDTRPADSLHGIVSTFHKNSDLPVTSDSYNQELFYPDFQSDCNLFGTQVEVMHLGKTLAHLQAMSTPSVAATANQPDRPIGGLDQRNTANADGEACLPSSPSRPFVKRASTVSMGSSTISDSPGRRSSLLKRLSRRTSKSSKHEDLAMMEFDIGNLQGRNIELKRRKTLDDYNINDEQIRDEDDEMIFV